MPWDCRVQGEFQPRDLLRQVQPVRVGSRFQASQAAGPQAGPFPQTSVNTGEMDEKFLKVILEKADRLWGSPRFCKRGLLPQPITFSWSICSGAFCCCAQFESDHTLLEPVQRNAVVHAILSVKMALLRCYNCLSHTGQLCAIWQ